VLASVGTWLEHFHGPVVYLLCGGLVLAETGLFVGFFFPGETAALAGGALASLGRVNVVFMVLVVVGCAIAGNLLGYEVGKLIGPWLMRHWPRRGRSGVSKAEQLVARYGGPGVFLGRWVAVIRALVPGLAGMSGMGYPTFVFFTVIGGITWGTAYVFIGYAAGTAYSAVATRIGLYALAVVGVVVLLVAVKFVRRRRRRRNSPAVVPADRAPKELGHDAGPVIGRRAEDGPGQ
jgi:membrane-associated protein